jgi:hypothetical protein
MKTKDKVNTYLYAPSKESNSTYRFKTRTFEFFKIKEVKDSSLLIVLVNKKYINEDYVYTTYTDKEIGQEFLVKETICASGKQLYRNDKGREFTPIVRKNKFKEITTWY